MQSFWAAADIIPLMAALRDYEYIEQDAPRLRRRRSFAPRPTLPTSFWLGAGIGLIFSTAAVVTAISVTNRARRPRQNGDDFDPVVNLTEAVQEGLDVLSQAAQHLGYSFENARRELVRFGLDPLISGIGGSGYSGEPDDPTNPLYEDDGSPEEWQGAGSIWEDEVPSSNGSEPGAGGEPLSGVN